MTGSWKGIPSPVALRQAAALELHALAAQLAETAPGQSVHGARRRIKLLRSQLRLLRPALGDENFAACNAALRAAAAALAGQRRAEALALAGKKLESSYWQRVAEDYRLAHAATQDPAESLAAARAAITSAATRLDGVVLMEVEGAVEAAFLTTYARARKRLRRAVKGGDATELHEARKCVIHHLHHLKLLHPDGESRLAALESLREVLGDLNDLAELEQLAVPAPVGKADARCMRKARRRLLARVRKAEGKLFRRKGRSWKVRLGHAAKPRSLHAPPALQAGG
jgi:hypothetical protein